MKTLIALLAALFAIPAVPQPKPLYELVHRFPLGDAGRWDYLTFDPDANRLFIAHGSEVLVVDAASGKQLAAIPASGAHGIALVKEQNRGFITNGREGTVTVFDLHSLNTIRQIKAGENPDAVVCDPYSRRVLVMNGRSHDLMVIDPVTLKIDADTPLGGKLEFAATDASHVYVNVEDTSEIAVVDSKTWKATQRWKLAGCEDPTGLAIDDAHERLFAACSNSKIVVIDSGTGKTLEELKTGSGTDAVVYDPAERVLFASNGEGTLTVIRETATGRYEVAGNVTTKPGARTMALDPKSRSVFLITAEPSAKGKPEFVLLVYAPAS